MDIKIKIKFLINVEYSELYQYVKLNSNFYCMTLY